MINDTVEKFNQNLPSPSVHGQIVVSFDSSNKN